MIKMIKREKLFRNTYPLNDQIIKALFNYWNTIANDTFNNLSKDTFFLNLYEFNVLVFYTQQKFGELTGVDTDSFREVANAKKKLYFSCVINKEEQYWYPSMIIYNSDPDKTLLIRKTVLKTFKPYFPNIEFDEKSSKLSKLTLFDFNV